MAGRFKMTPNPPLTKNDGIFKNKTRIESSGYKWVDNPTKDHTMDRYESTIYKKDDQYQGGLLKITDQNTSEETYTKYKPNKKPGLPAESKEISEKRYNRIKKRKSKKYNLKD